MNEGSRHFDPGGQLSVGLSGCEEGRDSGDRGRLCHIVQYDLDGSEISRDAENQDLRIRR